METTREEILSSIKGKTTSAKKIPYWWGNECQPHIFYEQLCIVFFPRLWIIIAKSLGIKLHPNEKPITSAILHILTFGSAAGTKDHEDVFFLIKFIPALFVTNGLISGYSVMSKHTKEDILDGTVSVMVMSFFCGLGVYSHRLAYRYCQCSFSRFKKQIFCRLWVHCQAKLFVLGFWRTLLKVTWTALWSEASSVSTWSTLMHFQICTTDWWQKT